MKRYNQNHWSKKQSGVTLLIAILILSTVLAVSLSLATILLSESRSSGDLLRSEPALYAGTGISEEVLFNIRRSTGVTTYSSSVGTLAVSSTSTPLNDPVQRVKVPSTNTSFGCGVNCYALYNPSSPYGTGGYGRIKVSFLDTNTPNTQLHIYLCQWDPANPPTNPDGTYKNLCSSQGDTSYMTFRDTNPAPLSPGQTWDSTLNCGGCMDTTGGKQQELILYQTTVSGQPADAYVQVSTFDSAGNPKGLPYFGQTAVAIISSNSGVNRNIKVVTPNVFSAPTLPSVAAILAVSAPRTATLGTQFNNLHVEARDILGNVVTGYSGPIKFTSTDPLAVLPPNSSLTGGAGDFSVTLKTVGSMTITATDVATSTLTGVSWPVVVSPTTFNGFAHRRTITVAGSQISQANHNTLTNFPVLVCMNGAAPCNASVPGLNQIGGGAHVTNANGYDVVFTTDSGCTSNLTWETEKYVAATGELEAWVKAPSLVYNSNYTFYMCYGNGSVSTFQSTPSAVWVNYKGVWHFPNGTVLSANDSTGSENGTINGAPSAIAGYVDGGVNFSGATDFFSIPSISLTSASNYTVSTWFKWPLPNNGSWNTLFRGSGGGDHVVIVNNSTLHLGVWDNIQSTGFHDSGYSMAGLSGGWHYLVAVGNRTITNTNFSIDGTFVGNANYASGGDISYIGNYQGGGQQWGIADEVRIGTGAGATLTSLGDWGKTEYLNQSAPASFCSVGAEN